MVALRGSYLLAKNGALFIYPTPKMNAIRAGTTFVEELFVGPARGWMRRPYAVSLSPSTMPRTRRALVSGEVDPTAPIVQRGYLY